MSYKEIDFETVLESDLLTNGYVNIAMSGYGIKTALFTQQVIDFIKATQRTEWVYLEALHKDKTAEILLDDLCKALNSENQGCLSVIRHGFKCYGRSIRMAYFKPSSGLNPDAQKDYDSNICGITRQVKYSEVNANSLDMVISLNGIPIITLELKNHLTGQTYRDAIWQYKQNRDPGELLLNFKKRTLVHFAVDPDEVYMTTKLEGNSTRFLPFNKGYNNGAGNPPNPDGYKTAYLWQSILNKDTLLEIIGKFMHLQIEEKTIGAKKISKESLIFPRYHQLDCVTKLIANAKTSGTGTNYLVQHSAGSGKSNTIAWLAHRLSSLHDDKDNKIYDSVVVVTDRLVLDQQLQNTIYQFEHKQGVVQKINKDSTQLADALKSGVPIIITTLQKFPFVSEKIGKLPKRRYAVIIDEAHSSQSGERAAELKRVLGIKANEMETNPENMADYEEELLRIMLSRTQQPNMSFFAFTATPKYKTLEVFGIMGADGKPRSFHLYSMRQAIEEGFILDVLKYYTTYHSYFGLIKAIENDPKLNKRKAAIALARFLSLHPHNISQKTEVIVEHFRTHTIYKIGGKAKAMVVTGSREHAVRYKLEFDKYINEKGYKDIRTLVAFSGSIKVDDMEYTEPQMNKGIREKELPGVFAGDDYNVLLVAEKYQTGFDQPLLHTMYVDKRLDGIQAVQTLSRLNRICSGKEDTFILDFVNDAETIAGAFQPYYESTGVGERVEPQQLYELKAKLDALQVYYQSEVEEFARVFYKPKVQQSSVDHTKLNRCIDPAVIRYNEKKEEEQDSFKKDLTTFKHLYSFAAQIIPFQDSDLEKLYSYGRMLLAKLPKRDDGPRYQFDEEVALKYYRIQKMMENTAIGLEKGKPGEIEGPVEVGTRKAKDEEVVLSELIDILNDRFGTNFTPADQLFFDSIKEDALANETIRQAAQVNKIDNFSILFFKKLEELFITRLDQNQSIATKFFNEDDFRKLISQELMKQVYKTARKEV